jgi:hypothetical protein
MWEVISTVYELADLGLSVIPVKSQTSPIKLHHGQGYFKRSRLCSERSESIPPDKPEHER